MSQKTEQEAADAAALAAVHAEIPPMTDEKRAELAQKFTDESPSPQAATVPADVDPQAKVLIKHDDIDEPYECTMEQFLVVYKDKGFTILEQGVPGVAFTKTAIDPAGAVQPPVV